MDTLRGAAFFDRDGVINEDRGYVHRISDFALMPGAADAIRACNDAGLFVFVVTNQSGVARGYYNTGAVEDLHRHMVQVLAAEGARIDDIRYCPHLPTGSVMPFATDCRCRKPAPGMICDLLALWPVDAARSFLVGDKLSDVAAAQAAGIPGYLLHNVDLDKLVGQILDAQEIG